MPDTTPPPDESVRAGYEVRDANTSLLVTTAVVLVVVGVSLLVLVWELARQVLPTGSPAPGVSPPVVMPGDAPVNDRLGAVPRPRLDPLEPLNADPPSFRSSRPVPGESSREQHPEDLRADRQPQLAEYRWVEPGKVAVIPIGRAMDAVVESSRTKAAAAKGGGK